MGQSWKREHWSYDAVKPVFIPDLSPHVNTHFVWSDDAYLSVEHARKLVTLLHQLVKLVHRPT